MLISVGAESNGRLTAREFHYREKLFDTLGISEEAIGKSFEELTSILKKGGNSFEEDLKHKGKLICGINFGRYLVYWVMIKLKS